MHTLKTIIKTVVPAPLFASALSTYHYCLAYTGAVLYGFPSRKLTVIGVTGTKGKSSTVEYINAIFEAAGYTTALTSTIRFKTADTSELNRRKMSMPGRFFVQHFLRRAVDAGCTVAILEITSEATLQHRHRFIDLDALVFTNLSPEHIESHGSLEAYAEAKLDIGRALVASRKRPRVMVANLDDVQGTRFLALPVDRAIPFSKQIAEPIVLGEHGSTFTFEQTECTLAQPGMHNVMNALAAAMVARALGIPPVTIARGLSSVAVIPGRTQEIIVSPEQPFSVVIDYAHTADSLDALYTAYGAKQKVCVLGAAGGGRDKWKRPEMARVAERQCTHVILTNEDPYDEDPHTILNEMAAGMSTQPEMMLDRRAAIAHALTLASPGGVVLISGKGSESAIMGPHGTKTPWSDARVAQEELEKFLRGK